MRLFTLLMVLAVCTAFRFTVQQSGSGYDPYRLYTVEQLRQDFGVLRKTLEDRHPSIYRYSSREEMNRHFDDVYRQLNRPMTETAFGDLLRPLIVQIRCGHTDLQESLSYRRWRSKPKPEWLPFEMVLANNRLYIGRNRSTDSTLVPGTEVVKLGNYPVSEVVTFAKNRWPSDGYNETFKDYFLELYFLEEIYWKHFDGRSPWTLTVRDTTGCERITTIQRRPRINGTDLNPVPFNANVSTEKIDRFTKAMRKIRKSGPQKLDHDEVKLQLMRSLHFPASDSSVAILIINGFSYEKHESFHRDVFRTLKQARTRSLIIDLRQNMGGNAEIGADLMAYLVDSTFRQVDRAECRVRKPNAWAYFDRKEKRLLRQNFRYLGKGNDRYLFGKSNVGWMEPVNEYTFKGNVYVLTSGRTFSAASIFAASLKAQRPVKLIGQETGGGEAGCNGGIIQTLTLPNTRLRVRFPIFWIATATRQPDRGRGVMPDIPVTYGVWDRIRQRDLEVERALKLAVEDQGATVRK
ncbi:S41 family peptidase [Nibrella saemangeumensis]|uniref:S41 family peptidase n=1 Tax=Nibrella saemangeumensis TaxID=1084526 RepID=A0ABP8MDY0_9BACT